MNRKKALVGLAVILLVLALPSCKKPNHPPDTPAVPSGPDSGAVRDTLTFSASATDPDGDSVSIRFDWGDGDTSGWSDPVPGGNAVSAAHAWASLGTYLVHAWARDNQDSRSSPSDALSVAITAATVLPDSLVAEIEMFDDVVDGNVVVVSPDGQFVYFALYSGVCPIRTADNVIAATIQLSSDVEALVGSPDGTRLFAISDNRTMDTIFTINTQDYVVTNRTPMPRLVDLAVSPSGESLWALTPESLLIIRSSDMTVAGRLPLSGQYPNAIAFALDGQQVFVACYTKVMAISTSDGSVTGLIPVHGDIESMCLSSDGSKLFLKDWYRLLEVSISGFTVSDSVAAEVCMIAVSPLGEYVYGTSGDSVYIIGTEPLRVLHSFEFFGCECFHPIAVLPDGQHLYTATHRMAYGYACPGSRLTGSPWPKFHHDLRNTGRVGGR